MKNAFFATEYTIHFDDTMAYGSHHFLTGFKFQCASRETFVFGEFLFDTPGVPEEYDQVHFFTSDAYSRNLKSKRLGDRVAILLSLEEWGNVSARFCYRVIDADGDPVCAGFQTLVVADAKTGNPILTPPLVKRSMNQVRQIEEPIGEISFRDRVLAGGGKIDPLFNDEICQLAVEFLNSSRYPKPQVVSSDKSLTSPIKLSTVLAEEAAAAEQESPLAVTPPVAQKPESLDADEVWVFAGQGAFDAELFVSRVKAWRQTGPAADADLRRCETVIADALGGDAAAFNSEYTERILAATQRTPDLLQPAIHLQNVLGGICLLYTSPSPRD